jgi:signal peptidase I
VSGEIADATVAGARAAPRRLHPGLAFLGGLVGLGYLYVGRLGYAIAFAVAPYVLMFAVGWTRLIVDPVGWYVYLGILGTGFAMQVVHPVAIAWTRPLAPAKQYNRWWCYAAWLLGVALLSTVVVPERGTTLGYEFYTTPSGSMAPTLQPGDMVVVDTWRYVEVSPEHGDLVVFDDGDGVKLIKRLVGLPGDTVEVRGTSLVRNGVSVDEPYLGPQQPGVQLPDFPPLKLADDEFFVLGDFRNNSRDSRQMGPVPQARISGRVEFIGFSLSDGIRWERFPLRLADD